ncbi:unnamed protein product [Hymenolepis diminuta]|uniref:Secreted protein n=1 Tax=Hymenolepis diminuta TaxID=6216 RepID=A0A0R3SBK9_HYMDI|nr:unnamed protein product [Hymenolepis diminuta]
MDLLILFTIAFVQTVLSMPYQSESKHHKLDNDWAEETRDDSETPMTKTNFHWLPTYRKELVKVFFTALGNTNGTNNDAGAGSYLDQ